MLKKKIICDKTFISIERYKMKMTKKWNQIPYRISQCEHQANKTSNFNVKSTGNNNFHMHTHTHTKNAFKPILYTQQLHVTHTHILGVICKF